jgi:hypothetical protein
MTMKRILHCTLMFMVLVTSGCGFWSDDSTARPNANSSPTPRTDNKIDFVGAERDVQEALTKLNSLGRSGQPATVKPVKLEINKAIEKLAQKERDRCTDCTEETKNGAVDVFRNLNGILTKLGADSTAIADLGEDDLKPQVQGSLKAAAIKLSELSTAKPKGIENQPPPSPSSSLESDNANQSITNAGWWSTLVLALQIAGVLVTLVLLVSAFIYVWKRAWKTIEFKMGHVVARHLAATREAQPDYASKLSSLSSAQAEVSSNLTELTTEVRSLARLVRDSIATRRSDRNSSYGDGFGYRSQVEDVTPKEEPEFPVSVVDYLGKMTRFSNVVRPDFQNGILVNAPDGDGELVLIRDSRDETQPLFVVPRAPQFHTKQDFYTYYQKYYDCVKPSAGDVWIIGPALVEKVTGGWQLREKGMLEVR